MAPGRVDVRVRPGPTQLAVMESLVRTAVGPFQRETALPLGEVSPESVPAVLLPSQAAVPHLPQIVLTTADVEAAGRGVILQLESSASEAPPVIPCPPLAEAYAAVDAAGDMVGLLRRHESGGYRLRPNFRGHG